MPKDIRRYGWDQVSIPEERPDIDAMIDEDTWEAIAHDRHLRALGGVSTLLRPRDLHSEAGQAWLRTQNQRRLSDLQRSVAITDWPAPLRSMPRDREETQETEGPETSPHRRQR